MYYIHIRIFFKVYYKVKKMTTISRTNSNDSVWVAQCICDRYDGYGNVIHCCPEELREQRDKEDQERVDKMKSTYDPDMWIWFVEGTVNDCELAAVHRRWLHKKGFPEDFDIHDDAQRELYYGKYDEKEEDGNHEQEEKEPKKELSTLEYLKVNYGSGKEFEKKYVQWMRDLYDDLDDWCYCVRGTSNDCYVARQYRKEMYERLAKNPGKNINTLDALKKALKKDEEDEEQEKEKENAYVYQMHQKYGGQWCWTVENTKDDSSIAEKHRQWVDDKCQCQSLYVYESD